MAPLRSSRRLPDRTTHRRDDLVGFWPRHAQEFLDQPALSRPDHATVDENVELSAATAALDPDVTPERLLDPDGETRRSFALASGFAVDDPNVHGSDRRARGWDENGDCQVSELLCPTGQVRHRVAPKSLSGHPVRTRDVVERVSIRAGLESRIADSPVWDEGRMWNTLWPEREWGLPRISPTMLSQRLRPLEDAGIVGKKGSRSSNALTSCQ